MAIEDNLHVQKALLQMSAEDVVDKAMSSSLVLMEYLNGTAEMCRGILKDIIGTIGLERVLALEDISNTVIDRESEPLMEKVVRRLEKGGAKISEEIMRELRTVVRDAVSLQVVLVLHQNGLPNPKIEIPIREKNIDEVKLAEIVKSAVKAKKMMHQLKVANIHTNRNLETFYRYVVKAYEFLGEGENTPEGLKNMYREKTPPSYKNRYPHGKWGYVEFEAVKKYLDDINGTSLTEVYLIK